MPRILPPDRIASHPLQGHEPVCRGPRPWEPSLLFYFSPIDNEDSDILRYFGGLLAYDRCENGLLFLLGSLDKGEYALSKRLRPIDQVKAQPLGYRADSSDDSFMTWDPDNIPADVP